MSHAYTIPADLIESVEGEVKELQMHIATTAAVMAVMAFAAFIDLPPEITGAIFAAGAALIGFIGWQIRTVIKVVAAVLLRGWVRKKAIKAGADPDEWEREHLS